MLFFYILIFIFLILFLFLHNNKLHVDWKTLFKKGFPKHDEKFGLYTYTGKQGEGKTYSAIKFVDNQRKFNNYIVITNIHSYKAENVIYIDNIINLINFVKLNHGKDGKKYLIFLMRFLLF